MLFILLLILAGNATAQGNYQVASVRNPGTITGTVKWSDPRPRSLSFPINKDPEICDPESRRIETWNG
jgi:hypothetical protein